MFKSVYAIAREGNDKVSLKGKNALIVGGTGAIGIGVAARLASLGANIVIVGRNEAVAKEIKPSSGSSVRFVKADVQLMANVRQAVTEIERFPEIVTGGIDYLVLCCGKVVTEQSHTAEGRDLFLALSFWARILFIHLLIPQVARCSGVVFNIHRGGADAKNENPIDVTDLDLKRTPYSLWTVTGFSGVLFNAMFHQYAKIHASSNIQFIHIFPGLIKTEGFRDCPLSIRSVLFLFGALLFTSVEDNANMMVNVMIKNYGLNTGSKFVMYGNTGIVVEPSVGCTAVKDDESLKVYDAVVGVLGV
ncbi:hypothetical protein HDU76_009947 [Blyttiomyces sp. JEL0837]|nr:hypothetical protein HDU76_009947 [Blyttiomyces sp. JEL0837]